MFSIIKQFYWSIKRKSGRWALWHFFLKDIPGEYGIEIRRRCYRRYFGRMGNNVVIHPGALIINVDKLFVGDGSHVGVANMLQAAGGIEMGNHVVLGPGVKIWSANHKFDDIDKPIMEQGYEFKKVVIDDHCWIGAGVFIMPGAILGKGVIVSAGSVVGGKTIPPYKILAGNPARVIGSRESSDIPPFADTESTKLPPNNESEK